MKRFQPTLMGIAITILLVMLFAATKLWVERNARTSLGGDVEISRENAVADIGVNAYLGMNSKAVSHVMTLRAEALVAGKDGAPPAAVPVLVKSFFAPYPLYGKFKLDQKRRKRTLGWFPKAKANGVAMSQVSMQKLGVALGTRFTIGDNAFIVSAIVVKEPDHPVETADDAPRLFVNAAAFDELAAKKPVNVPVIHYYRARMTPQGDVATWTENFEKMFPEERGWHVRDWRDNAPWIIYAIRWSYITVALIILLGLLLKKLPSGRRHNV